MVKHAQPNWLPTTAVATPTPPDAGERCTKVAPPHVVIARSTALLPLPSAPEYCGTLAPLSLSPQDVIGGINDLVAVVIARQRGTDTVCNSKAPISALRRLRLARTTATLIGGQILRDYCPC